MNEISEIAIKNQELSQEYAQARMDYAKNQMSFDIILASKMPIYQKERRGIGYEVARLMLLAEGDSEVIGYETKAREAEARYKGLERIIESNKDRLYTERALLKLGGE